MVLMTMLKKNSKILLSAKYKYSKPNSLIDMSWANLYHKTSPHLRNYFPFGGSSAASCSMRLRSSSGLSKKLLRLM